MRPSKLALAVVGIVTFIVLLAPGAAADHGCGSPDDPGAIAGTTNEDGDALPLVGVCSQQNDTRVRAHAGEDWDEVTCCWGWILYRQEDVGAWARADLNQDANVTRADFARASVVCRTNPNTEDPNANERCRFVRGRVDVDTDGDVAFNLDVDAFLDPQTRSLDVEVDVDENVLPGTQVPLP